MQSFLRGFAAAVTLVFMIPSIGIADDRGISTNEPLACNSLCRWWMAQGKPAPVVTQPLAADDVSIRPTLDRTVLAPSRAPSKTRSVAAVTLLRKPALKPTASADLSAAKKLIAAIPTMAVRRPDPAPLAEGSAAPTVDVTTTLQPSPALPSSTDLIADKSDKSIARLAPFPSQNQKEKNVEQVRRSEWVEAVHLAPSATKAVISRPIRTLAGRIEAAAVVASMLAMMASLKRLSLPVRWKAPRAA